MKIKLASINDVKDFCNAINKCPIDVDLKGGRYIVDAKSIMGIFSLDLSKTLELIIDEDQVSKECYTNLQKFEVVS